MNEYYHNLENKHELSRSIGYFRHVRFQSYPYMFYNII